MRLPVLRSLPAGAHELPLWPPLLATRGRGSKSEPHSHHAMHLILALDGVLKVRAPLGEPWTEAAGVLTAPDAKHAIDARGMEVMLVFFDPESDVGSALGQLVNGPVRVVSEAQRAKLARNADPGAIMRAAGVDWTRRAVKVLGAPAVSGVRRSVHPRVKKALRLLREGASETSKGRNSLEALAESVGLSPGRLMHVFTESIGIPLRPYLAWLKLQRAAGAIVGGVPLAEAAHSSGFADAAHMTRTFRRMFGVAPSELRPERCP
jgi:AraC-like DNA-binding protein